MRSGMVAAAVLTLALSAVPAWAWQAQNGNDVLPVSGSVFEVVQRGRSSASEFWCSAGDYAIRVLGTSATQRVYIWRPVGPSTTVQGRKAVQFSLSPPEGADTSTGYSLSVKRAGDNLTAAAARQYCFGRLRDF